MAWKVYPMIPAQKYDLIRLVWIRFDEMVMIMKLISVGMDMMIIINEVYYKKLLYCTIRTNEQPLRYYDYVCYGMLF